MAKRLTRLTTAKVAGIIVAALAVTGGATAALVTGEFEQGPPPAAPVIAPIGQLNVFTRPATALELRADQSPVLESRIAALTDAPAGVSEDLLPGVIQPGSLRLPFGSSGPEAYIFRTTRGRVCAGIIGLTAGCYAGLPSAEPVAPTVIDPDATGAGQPLVVWGLATNSVKRVSVEISGASFAARLSDNIFYLDAPNTTTTQDQVTSVIATLSDGTSITVATAGGASPSRF